MFEILEAEVLFRSQRLATPLKLSSGIIETLTQATVSVIGEVDGRELQLSRVQFGIGETPQNQL